MFAQTERELISTSAKDRLTKFTNNSQLSSPKIITTFTKFNSLTPTLNWEKVYNANGYTIYINEIKDSKENEIFNSTYHGIISSLEFTIPDGYLKNKVQYSLTMRAFNSDGWSDYTDKYFFTIELPVKENLLSTPNVISKNNYLTEINNGTERNLLIWENVKLAEMYEIIIEGINSSSIFGEEFTLIEDLNISDTMYIIDGDELFKIMINIDGG